MDWKGIWGEVIAGIILLIIGGIGGWFAGLFKGKKESSSAIERKDKIYQPLLDEIVKYSDFKWTILEKLNVRFLRDITNASYKYGLSKELQNKCNYLYEIMSTYNSIDPLRIADSIIVDIFTIAYEKIYGSIIAGVSYHSDRDGNEWEEEVIVEPVHVIKQINKSKEIKSLLYNEGMFSDEVCIDEENGLFEPIYLQLKRIYSLALHVTINGEQYKHPKPVIDLKMSPEEYMAYQYDFFELYNSDERIKQKYEFAFPGKTVLIRGTKN